MFSTYCSFRGLAGSKEINTTVARVRGKLLLEGDNRTRMRAIYHWQQVRHRNSFFFTLPTLGTHDSQQNTGTHRL